MRMSGRRVHSGNGHSGRRVAAILPAYNEAERVQHVLSAVVNAPSVHQVVVVNDGSTDDTAARVLEVDGVYLLSLPHNVGKGGAMVAGARFTDADVLLFLDADLIGLTPEHVERIVRPVISGEAQMSVGRFSGGRYLTDLSQRIVPSISGQRAMVRDVFDSIPCVEDARYGVEMLITRFCRHYRVPTTTVSLVGVTHPMKEEKLGVWRGWAARTRMYSQILRIMLDPRAPVRRRPRAMRRQSPLHQWKTTPAGTFIMGKLSSKGPAHSSTRVPHIRR